ncbi:MAG: hypothetical protein IK074_04235, partial [Bacteroidales bacterium]|nr:hypothetical protein [Bacteroidales bacterium]
MTHLLANISPSVFSWIVLALMLAYFTITALTIKNNPKLLWIPATLLLLTSTALYSSAYWVGGAKTVFSNLYMSLAAALDLFLFKMNSTYGRFTDLFYLKPDGVEDPLVLNRLVLLVGLYLCSIWTTSIMVMHFFARRLVSRLSLAWAWFRKKGNGIHLFVGINPQSMALAKSLAKEEKVVFVDLPTPDLLPDKLSLTQIFKGVRAGSDQSVRMKEVRK